MAAEAGMQPIEFWSCSMHDFICFWNGYQKKQTQNARDLQAAAVLTGHYTNLFNWQLYTQNKKPGDIIDEIYHRRSQGKRQGDIAIPEGQSRRDIHLKNNTQWKQIK